MGFYYERNIYVKLNDFTVELGSELPEEITKYMNLITNKSNLAISNSYKNISKISHISNINKTNVNSNTNISFITLPDSNHNTCLNYHDINNKNLKTS